MMTGRHVTWFFCNETSAPSAVSRFVEGAAMDGCWSCFDGVHRLQRQTLKILIDNVQSVMDAIRTKISHCVLTSGSQVHTHTYVHTHTHKQAHIHVCTYYTCILLLLL